MSLGKKLWLYEEEKRKIEQKMGEVGAPWKRRILEQQLGHVEESIRQCREKIMESEKIFDEAMNAGYVEVSNTNILMLGMAGTGKTSTMRMIFGLLPPEVRNSTLLAEVPVRVRICDIPGFGVQSGEAQWKPVESQELEQMVIEMVSSIACNNAPTAAATTAFSNPASTQSETTASTSSDTSATSISTHASSSPLQAYIASLHGGIVSSLEKEKASEADVSKVLGSNWIYFIDSGGQPHFHSLLPHFIQGISFALFTFRLCDDPNYRPLVEYYEEGQSVGVPYTSSLTTMESLKRLVSSMQSHTEEGEKPKLIFIGTHLDMIPAEALKEKNAQLLELLDPECLDQVVFHDVALNQLIFAIDAHHPGEHEKRITQLIRSVIKSSPSRKVLVPVRWYVLEIILEKMSAFLGRKVLSKQECLEVARNLNFGEHVLVAALNFLNDKHLLHYYPDVLPDVVFASPQVLLDKLTELVKEAYRLRESSTNPFAISSQAFVVRSGEWRQFRDQGIVTLRFLERFPKHYVDGLFTPSDLLKIFTELLILTPFLASLHKQVDFTSPFFMPSLLDMLPSADLEKYRVFSSVEPLVIFFPGGSLRSGVFCCLQVHLIQQLGWRLVHTDGKPNVIAQNCVMLAHPRMPCIIVLIDSFSYLEVHVDAELSVCRKVCPSICEDVLKGIQASNRALRYSSEQPQLAFFCQCSQAYSSPSANATAPTSSGASVSSPPSRHIAHVLESRGWIQCSVQQKEFSPITNRQGVWLGVSATADSPATILDVDTHLWPVMTAVHEARTHWKNIGRALRVSETAIRAIHDSDDGECLYQVLLVWMESGRATIHDLLKALEHRIVGCAKIAEKIRSLEGQDRIDIGL